MIDQFDWAFKTSTLMPQESIFLMSKNRELLLLSWLIVLMRSREGSQFQFEWAYQLHENDDEQDIARTLSLKEAVPGLQSTIGQGIEAISEYLRTAPSPQIFRTSNAKGILLSTGSLSESPENEVSKGQIWGCKC